MPYNPTWNNPYLQQQQQLLPPLYQPQQSVNGVIKVNGRESALQYQLPPNSMSPALFDNNGQVFYVVSTDGTGTKTIETFDFSPHIDKQEQPLDTNQYVTRAEFDELKTKIGQLIGDNNGIHEPIPTTTSTPTAFDNKQVQQHQAGI